MKLGQKKVIENLDIFEKVGVNATHDEYIEFFLKGDQLLYKSENIRDAIIKKEQTRHINIEFEKVIGEPIVQGLILY